MKSGISPNHDFLKEAPKVWLYKPALDIAQDVRLKLQGCCKKIFIAGSLRRQKSVIGDIEILCEPNLDFIQLDMFTEGETRAAEFKRLVRSLGTITSGSVDDGKAMKMLLPQGIKLDLFLPDPKDFFRQLAIRTGSSEYSWRVIAKGWVDKGWCGTVNAGLRRKEDCVSFDESGKKKWKCIKLDGQTPPVWKSEEEFFEWIGVRWIHPKQRI